MVSEGWRSVRRYLMVGKTTLLWSLDMRPMPSRRWSISLVLILALSGTAMGCASSAVKWAKVSRQRQQSRLSYIHKLESLLRRLRGSSHVPARVMRQAHGRSLRAYAHSRRVPMARARWQRRRTASWKRRRELKNRRAKSPRIAQILDRLAQLHWDSHRWQTRRRDKELRDPRMTMRLSRSVSCGHHCERALLYASEFVDDYPEHPTADRVFGVALRALMAHVDSGKRASLSRPSYRSELVQRTRQLLQGSPAKGTLGSLCLDLGAHYLGQDQLHYAKQLLYTAGCLLPNRAVKPSTVACLRPAGAKGHCAVRESHDVIRAHLAELHVRLNRADQAEELFRQKGAMTCPSSPLPATLAAFGVKSPAELEKAAVQVLDEARAFGHRGQREAALKAVASAKRAIARLAYRQRRLRAHSANVERLQTQADELAQEMCAPLTRLAAEALARQKTDEASRLQALMGARVCSAARARLSPSEKRQLKQIRRAVALRRREEQAEARRREQERRLAMEERTHLQKLRVASRRWRSAVLRAQARCRSFHAWLGVEKLKVRRVASRGFEAKERAIERLSQRAEQRFKPVQGAIDVAKGYLDVMQDELDSGEGRVRFGRADLIWAYRVIQSACTRR